MLYVNIESKKRGWYWGSTVRLRQDCIIPVFLLRKQLRIESSWKLNRQNGPKLPTSSSIALLPFQIGRGQNHPSPPLWLLFGWSTCLSKKFTEAVKSNRADQSTQSKKRSPSCGSTLSVCWCLLCVHSLDSSSFGFLYLTPCVTLIKSFCPKTP